MMNYLANLGFNDGTPKEIYTPKELIEAFDMSRIIKSPSMFDFEKLRWINGQHIRALPANELKPRVIAALTTGDPPILESSKFSADMSSSIATGSKEELFVNLATKIAQRDMELVSESSKFVGACLKYDIQESFRTDGEIAHVLDEPTFETVVKGIIEDFDNGVFPTCSAEEMPTQWKAYIKALGARLGIKGKTLFHPARVALTGRMSGPDIGDQLQLAKAAEGVISPSYPLADVKKRIDSLRTLNLAEAKAIAAATVVRLEAEAKQKAEAAAAAAALAAEEQQQLVNQ
jgi:glutamyl-tRNA synthetase